MNAKAIVVNTLYALAEQAFGAAVRRYPLIFRPLMPTTIRT